MTKYRFLVGPHTDPQATRVFGPYSEHECYDYAQFQAGGTIPITSIPPTCSDDETIRVDDSIETVEVVATWSDDHILCAKVLVNKGQDTEREQEIWWCGWEGVAALQYYNEAGSARDYVHGYGLFVDEEEYSIEIPCECCGGDLESECSCTGWTEDQMADALNAAITTTEPEIIEEFLTEFSLVIAESQVADEDPAVLLDYLVEQLNTYVSGTDPLQRLRMREDAMAVYTPAAQAYERSRQETNDDA